MEKLLTAILGLLMAMIAIGVLCVCIDFGDWAFSSDCQDIGTVVERQYAPAFWALCGRVPMHRPERWMLIVSGGKGKYRIEVSHEQYEAIEEGARIHVGYSKGPFGLTHGAKVLK